MVKHLSKWAMAASTLLLSFSSNGQGMIEQIKSQLIEKKQVTENDVQDLRESSSHSFQKTNLTYFYAQQYFEGIPVFNAMAIAAFRDEKLVNLNHNLVLQDLYRKANEGFIISWEDALKNTFDYLKLTQALPAKKTDIRNSANVQYFQSEGISSEEVFVEKYWLLFNDEILPVYNVVVQPNGSPDWWNVRIDARNGKYLEKNNWTSSCSPSDMKVRSFGSQILQGGRKSGTATTSLGATYNVYPLGTESPSHGQRSLEVDPAVLNASPHGWHSTVTNNPKQFTITRGNNVHAYEDQNNSNTPGFSPDGGDSLYFDFQVDFNKPAIVSMPAAVTNLFYQNNILHDVLYQYGFTEAAGNFQVNNYGKGGAGNDAVRAEAMDGGGTNNANFSTPTDGNAPRMQMYLWNTGGGNILKVDSPLTNSFPGTPASIGPPVATNPVSGEMVLYQDSSANPTLACQTTWQNLTGKIALIDRGSCNFAAKILNAQAAGAIGVIVANNQAGNPIAMGGQGAGITIPSIMVTQGVGNLLKGYLNANPAVFVSLSDSVFGFDSSFDNGVVQHEYGHGLSIRLTGGRMNSSCLNNQEQAGEGWSDLLALFFNTDSTNLPEQRRGIATWLINQPVTGQGIRPRPYSTSTIQNNLTYDNIKTLSVPHGVGTVWATMVWDMYWLLVDEHGFDNDIYNGTGGNNIAFQLVVEGLKLQRCNPGFADSRDAILQADTLLYKGANSCLIWEAFSGRGLGYSADQGLSSSRADGTQAFDMHPACLSVGVEERKTDEMTPRLFPNPAREYAYLDVAHFDGSAFITITDITGRVVLRDAVEIRPGDRLGIETHNYKAGTYFVELSTQKGEVWRGKMQVVR